MRTVGPTQGEAMVCDVGLPLVRSALASARAFTHRFQLDPEKGTRIDLIAGDPSALERCIREAIAEADR